MGSSSLSSPCSKDLKESLWVTRFEMSGDEWNFADEVDEAVEEAIITCNDWDFINNMGEK